MFALVYLNRQPVSKEYKNLDITTIFKTIPNSCFGLFLSVLILEHHEIVSWIKKPVLAKEL